VNPDRQKEPHAHAVQTGPGNRFAYVPDLGLDQVLIYRFDPAKGSLERNDPPYAALPPGSGPRHLAFHPNGRLAFVINELTCTIVAFEVDAARGGLTPVHTVSTLPEGETVQKGYSTAEVVVHPSGRFVYGSNRGHDTIVAFSLDEKTGRLTHVQHEKTQGSTPRNFAIDPTGAFLLAANQRSDSVVVFRIDQQTGRLAPAGHTIQVGSPVAVKFVK
jgi:6-phosphogluconolactonase